jgi:polysaccharide lyase family 4-like protein
MLFARNISTLSLAILALLSLPSAAAYEAVQVTDGGIIKGKVLYQGQIATKKILPTKDSEVCGEMREEPLIVVGPDKGVQDVVVYLKDVQKGKEPGKPAKKPEINNHKCQFEPHVQAVPVGSIVIVNSDPVMHNTHGFLGKQTVFNQALPTKGMRIEKPIKKPGMMRVECDTHGWMLAWIYAAEHPYYAVTKKDGTFSIPDVPPGSYTLVAWQEYTDATEVPVTVKSKEAAQQTIELKKK